ncbi:non-structural maintenance of chromosomes element 1 family protein [Aspergillus candidus]|uniref:Non-structural maintenance of chromosomes element 1 homolog n=1 Tax=Aspergillus candidus TaxID=41067 RepID=A0A2I2FGS8_ASPCN|nr:DNA repair protein [Aspergillus candidus]PLB39800.1 DNA repair protein [Aspergillus candidus]
MSDYNHSHRAFLQAFMARSTMTYEEACPILAAILSIYERNPISPEDVSEDDFYSYIATANSAISPFDLEICSTTRQVTLEPGAEAVRPEPIFVLVNTSSDPLTQLATAFSADEIAFVKRVLDYMFDTNNTRRCEAMVVSGIQAMQLAKASSGDANRRETQGGATQQTQGGAAQSLSMTQAETVMKQLVEDGWMEKSRKGFYSLGVRGLMELRGWLIATYNEEDEDGRKITRIKKCSACQDIITVGRRCGDRDCGGRLHDTCVRNFFRVQKAEKCPVCKGDWPDDKFVGERAITSTNGHRTEKRRSTQVQRPSAVGPSSQVPSDAMDGPADSPADEADSD